MAKKLDRPLTKGERTNLVTRAELGNMKLKAALFVLDQFANQAEGRWPNLSELASAMCGSKRTAQYALTSLCNLGIIDYCDASPGVASRRYSIDYERLMELQPEVRNLAFHPAGANGSDDPKSRGARSAPHANGAPHAESAPVQAVHPCKPCTRAESAPHASLAPQIGSDDPKSRGAGAAPPHIQTKSVKRRKEQNTEPNAAASDVSESSSGWPVCLLGPDKSEATKRAQNMLRWKLKGAELLRGNCVWARDISDLIEFASRDRDDGNPIPRIGEVIVMADDAKTTVKNRGGWIKEAIEKGWKPKGRRREVSA